MNLRVLFGADSEFLVNSIASSGAFQESMYVRARINRFADGEINVEVPVDLLGHSVFIIQSVTGSVNDSFVELLLLIDAAMRAGVAEIRLIIPYFCYARQDRVIRNTGWSSSLSATVIAEILGSRKVVKSIFVLDLHTAQIEGFFGIPVLNAQLFDKMADTILPLVENEDVVVVAPDAGALLRARQFSFYLGGVPIVVVEKFRSMAGVSHVMQIVGDVRGKHCIIVDDIVDSAGTLCNAVQSLYENGASTVSSCITHPVLSSGALNKIDNSGMKYFVVSDSVVRNYGEVNNVKVLLVSCASKVIDYITTYC